MTIDLDDLEAKARAATLGDLDRVMRDAKNHGIAAMNVYRADAAFIVAARNAVLELIARLRAAEGIVRDLAAFDCRLFEDQYDHGNPACVMCNWGRDGSNEGRDHAESCPYRRAVEATR